MFNSLFQKSKTSYAPHEFHCKKCGKTLKGEYCSDLPLKESTIWALGFHINGHKITKDEIINLLNPYYIISEDENNLKFNCNFCNYTDKVNKNKIGILSIQKIISHTTNHLSIIDQCDMGDRLLSTYFNY